jgi:thiamine biosynthesis lipoprotein
MGLIGRRQFLACAAGAGGLAALGSIRRLGRPGREGADGLGLGLKVFRQASFALGARVAITALHSDERIARQAVAASFTELARIEQVMSLYLADSELCRLNRSGRLDDPHPYLVSVLRKAQEIAACTCGAFDVTVQPLWDLYASSRRNACEIAASDMEAARRKVDWRKVDVSSGTIRLAGEDMAITLNGIAQGFAADCVLRVLRDRGIENALVDTGEAGSLGRKATGDRWTAGIQHPRRPDAYISLAALDGRCMATSGDYATAFAPDFTRHHIFDPATGDSPRELASVTVLAPSGIDADALSTAVFVLGPVKGRELIDATAGADALFVLKDGTVVATDNFPAVSQV